jgi:hypothetical protein
MTFNTLNILSRWLKQKPACRGTGPRRRSFRLGVETLEERQLLSTWFVTTAADNGDTANPTPGSLREAIILADNMGKAGDQIVFDIPNVPGQSDVHTIQPPTALPAVTTPLTINGYTQPGSAINTAVDFDNAQLKIVLDGSLLNTGDGLAITAGNSTVRGLVINHFPSLGVGLANVGNDTIAGNFIGTDVAGQTPAGNGLAGVYVVNGAGSNTIGGVALSDRNVISGNAIGDGIYLGTDGNFVQNNYLGTDSDGVVGVANAYGIVVQGSNNTIGGGSAGQGNNISGNFHDGITINQATSVSNYVFGNRITFNGGAGVVTDQGAHDNVIGDNLSSGPVNDISFNLKDGVHFFDGTGNFVNSDNSFSSNGGLAIDLGAAANNQQNFPVLTTAVVAGGQTTVTGTLHGTLNTVYYVYFWSNPSFAQPQGETYLGVLIGVKTDQNGNATFTKTFNTALAVGDTVTAITGTGSNGTSEFSAPVTVKMPPAPPQPPGMPPPQDVTPLVSVRRGKLLHHGGLYRQTITLHNAGAALQGPVYLVLDHLTRKVRLLHPTGRTAQKAPLGDPYMLAGTAGQVLNTGETRTVVLTFRNPLGRKIRYGLSVLAGVGTP